ncbi:MAG: twin-arginine translocase TatA/TatE family subunit [Chloroflexota bacterium]
MFHLGTTELIILFLIIVLLFGVGRIGKIAGEMGKGIREFRSGLTGKDEKEKTGESNEPIDQTKDDPQV